MIEADRDLSSSPVHVDRLVQYLDGNLKTLNTQLDESTFDRLLDLISQRVLHTFHNFICKDVEVLQLIQFFFTVRYRVS